MRNNLVKVPSSLTNLHAIFQEFSRIFKNFFVLAGGYNILQIEAYFIIPERNNHANIEIQASGSQYGGGKKVSTCKN